MKRSTVNSRQSTVQKFRSAHCRLSTVDCRPSRGFTLLEVMVAVAILGLGLTAVLSAMFGSVKAVAHARGISVGVGLARCKMSEIEEKLRRDGYQELDQKDNGACCGEGTPGYWCEWAIDKPQFPEASSGKLDLSTDALGGVGKLAEAARGGGSAPGAPGIGTQGGLPTPGGGLSSITDALGPGAGGLASQGVGGIASMVMQMAYPGIRKLFEASSRRITVTIHWDERGRDYNFSIVQWVTKPQPPAGLDNTPDILPTGPTPAGQAPPPTPAAGGR